jgi:hypothetical protein
MQYINHVAKKLLGDDKRRPALMQLHLDGDHVVATDCYILMAAPVKYFVMTEIKPVENYPEYKKVFPDYGNNTIHTVNVKHFIEMYDDVAENLYLHIDCEDCDGVGSLECDLGHTHDCETCDGTAQTKTSTIIGKSVPYSKYTVKIHDSFIKPDLIYKACIIAQAIGIETLEFKHLDGNKPAVALAGDIKFVMIPLYNNQESEAKIWEL